MKSNILELKVTELYFEDPSVRGRTVNKYLRGLKRGKKIDPIDVVNCLHNSNHYITNGHNRTAARYILDIETITSDARPCLEECTGDSFYDPSYIIKDVNVTFFFDKLKIPLEYYKRLLHKFNLV